jgi:ArsR family transcriptional regulator
MAGNKRQVQRLALLFRMLADPTRLRIVAALGQGELNVKQLCRKLRASQPGVSRHLGLLRMSCIVTARRDGREVFYSMSAPRQRHIGELLKLAAGQGR